jgi:hypothetical protein
MRKSWLLCVFMGALAWGQAAPATPPQPAPAQPGQAAPAPGGPMQHPQMSPGPGRIAPPPDNSATVPASAVVITIDGVCPARPRPATAAKAATVKPAADTKTTTPKTPADCKTTITKAEFETLAKGLSPTMTPQLKRQLANILPRLYAMSAEAKKKGLDKGPEYAAAVKFYQMQILSQQLQRKIQDTAAKDAGDKVQGYYDKNPEAYEQYSLERLFVPKAKQEPPAEEDKDKDKEEKLTDDQKKAKEDADKAKTEASEQEMTKLADTLRARAAAGEDFVKLQKEAFDAAGMKIESPTVSLPKVRRTGLPPAHSAVFELKVGEVSQVISDNGGHYIYKVDSKEVLPLDQVKDEIHNKLQNEDAKDEMEKVTNSFKATDNEAYFGPPTPGGMNGPPPRRMPSPHMPGSPVQPQTPPSGPGAAAPSQPPAAATQPN